MDFIPCSESYRTKPFKKKVLPSCSLDFNKETFSKYNSIIFLGLPSNYFKGLIALLSAATGYDLCQGLSAEWGNCSSYFQKLEDWKKPVCNASPCNGNKIGKDKIKIGIAFGGFRSK
jgi:hypothetical protein